MSLVNKFLDMQVVRYKNQNCLMCEAVCPNTVGNLANDSDEAALTHSFASPAFAGLALLNLTLLICLGRCRGTL